MKIGVFLVSFFIGCGIIFNYHHQKEIKSLQRNAIKQNRDIARMDSCIIQLQKLNGQK